MRNNPEVMKSRTWLLSLLATVAMAVSAQETKKVFIYSPDERAGLRIAQFSGSSWQEIGQLCSSDYGTWGAEKRMHHPSLARAKDGTWRLVFQVNDRSPLFAAAYSRDLVNWRPQDYPIMTTPQCLKPVVFANDNGTFDIYYQTKDGDKRWVSASNDFRQFNKDEKSLIDLAAWTRDTATIAGRLQEGCQFEMTAQELNTVTAHFEKMKQDARISGERMHDDAVNFKDLKDKALKATLTVTNQEKAISDKLIGIFFEDISYAADGGLYAELIQNRDFEYNAKDRREWNATTAWHSTQPIDIKTEHPLSKNNPHYAVIGSDTLWNEGWDGIAVEAGKKYDFSIYVLAGGQKQTFVIQLVGEDGTLLASSKLKTAGSDWQQYTTVLTAKRGDKKARLAIIPQKAARVGVDMPTS